MKKNMGNVDRLVRVLIAATLVALFFGNVITGTLGIIALVLAGVFVATSLTGFCPLYTLFGVNTCKYKSLT